MGYSAASDDPQRTQNALIEPGILFKPTDRFDQPICELVTLKCRLAMLRSFSSRADSSLITARAYMSGTRPHSGWACPPGTSLPPGKLGAPYLSSSGSIFAMKTNANHVVPAIICARTLHVTYACEYLLDTQVK